MLKRPVAALEADTPVRCGCRWCAAYTKSAMPTSRIERTFTYWYFWWAFFSRCTPTRILISII